MISRNILIAEGALDRALFTLRAATDPSNLARAAALVQTAARHLPTPDPGEVDDDLAGEVSPQGLHVLEEAERQGAADDAREEEWEPVDLPPAALKLFRCPALGRDLKVHQCLQNAVRQQEEPCSGECAMARLHASDLGAANLLRLLSE